MTQASQRRAVANNRRRLKDRGMARFEVRGLEADKELVRKLGKRLAADDADAQRLRAEMAQRENRAGVAFGLHCAGRRRSGRIWT